MELPTDKVLIFTDGAISGNGKPGSRAGFGVVLICAGANMICEVGQFIGEATSCIAELQAIDDGLARLTPDKLHKFAGVEIWCDSEYAIRSAIRYWRGAPVKNRVLIETIRVRLDYLASLTEIRFKHIRGHRGVYFNELADSLAMGAKNGESVERRRAITDEDRLEFARTYPGPGEITDYGACLPHKGSQRASRV